MEKEFKGVKYKFFWNGIFSNWYQSFFKVDGVEYNCGEQYMMYQKALTFEDVDMSKRILKEYSPKKQKQLGRKIKGFDSVEWNLVKFKLVKKGLYEKFNQNIELKKQLLKYKGFEFVEALPYDRIWGIGFEDYEAIENINDWGENLLGEILTELSLEL